MAVVPVHVMHEPQETWDLLHSPAPAVGNEGCQRDFAKSNRARRKLYIFLVERCCEKRVTVSRCWLWFLRPIVPFLFLQCDGIGKGLFQALWNFVKPAWQLYRQCGKTNKWRRWRSKLWFVVLFTSNHGPLYPGEHTIPAPAQTSRRWLILNSTTQHSVTLHPLLWN